MFSVRDRYRAVQGNQEGVFHGHESALSDAEELLHDSENTLRAKWVARRRFCLRQYEKLTILSPTLNRSPRARG